MSLYANACQCMSVYVDACIGCIGLKGFWVLGFDDSQGRGVCWRSAAGQGFGGLGFRV